MKLLKNRYTSIWIGIFFILIFGSCTPDPVEFKEITNARFVSNTGSAARVKADALFYNPNKSGGQVGKVDIIVAYKGQELAHVTEDSFVKVRAQEDFSIPLDIDLDLEKVQSNWLGGLISILQDKSLELHFTGSIKIKIHGVSRKIPVDYTERIKL